MFYFVLCLERSIVSQVLNLLRATLYLLFSILIWTPLILNAQNKSGCTNTIKGKVFDFVTKEPLGFVTIQIEGTGTGTYSDDNGDFLIENLCENEYELIFTRIGYKTLKHHHDFHHPEMEIFLVEDHLTLEGVTVEATYNQSGLKSINSTKLSGEELALIKSDGLGDIASQITGVSMITTGQNISKPIIHGLHSNRILVINNGIRHEFQNWGIEHAPEIDPSLANEIEVIKGAATVRYGPDALGGVILVNPPKLDLSTPIQGNLQLKGQSNGRSGEGTVNIQKGFKWWSIGANASYVKQGDLSAPDYLLTNTGKEEKSYSARFRIHPSPFFDIEGYYSHFEQELGILSGSVFGNLEDLQRAIETEPPQLTGPFSYDIQQPRQSNQHDLFKATAKYIGRNQSLAVHYGYQANTRREFGVRRGDAPNIDLELLTHSLDVDWIHPKIGPFSGKIGVQGLTQANDNLPGTNTVPFIPNYDQKRLGAYLIEQIELGNHGLEFGVRFDHQETDVVGREPDNTIYRNTVLYQNLSGTIGYNWQINDAHHFQTNLGTAWRAPNVAELYRFGQHAFYLEYGLWRYTVNDRFDFIVTTEGILDEEDRPVPAEVGYKWINTYSINKEGFRAEFTGYINYIENFINSKPGGITRTPRGVFVYYLNDQTDALFWGLDISTEIEHSQTLSSEIKGSYLWAKQITQDDYFVEQPPANINYQIEYRPKLKWFSETAFRLSLNYTFEQFQHPRIIPVDDFLNALQLDINRFTGDAKDFDILDPPPGYFLTNFAWTGQWKKFDFQLQVRNILNTSYRSYTDRLRYFADGVGRNFVAGIGYRF